MCLINVTKTFHTTLRSEWRAWLSQNYRTETEVWFVFPVKEADEECLSYNDAVEEALCFGWIDSIIKYVDEKHRARHFTPRRKGSAYSRPNIERLIWLNSHDMLLPEIKKDVLPLIETPYEFPKDIIEAIQENQKAWENYRNFSDSYRRIRVAYIDAARNRPEEFNKRLESFIKKTQDNKLIKGFGGIDKYYV